MKLSNWIAAGAVAATLTAASPALRAQDAASTAPSLDSIPVIAPVAPVDYSVLRHQDFTYMDLKQAHASGLSDNQIATVAKIADETGQPFSQVREDLMNGASFTTLATKYGLDLTDLYNVDDEKAKIDNYKQAYETTGTYAIRAMKMNDMSPGMSGGSSSMPMPAPTTSSAAMTPAPAATAMAPSPAGDVVDVAMATPQLSMLVKAIQAAGLVDTLRGAGPFTIFAPTNKAFSRVPKAQRNALMADPVALKNLLSYHVIAGQKIDAATAMSMTSPTSPPTVQGGTLNVVTSNGKVHVNDATVTKADIQASNGIIHIIDRVLMPSAAPAQ